MSTSSSRGKKGEELETRDYTIPLQRAWISPRHHRAVRCINVIKEFAIRHMKAEDVRIDSKLNELIWQRGIRNPPRRVKVRMEKDEDGLVTVLLPRSEEEEGREKVPEAGEVKKVGEEPMTEVQEEGGLQAESSDEKPISTTAESTSEITSKAPEEKQQAIEKKTPGKRPKREKN